MLPSSKHYWRIVYDAVFSTTAMYGVPSTSLITDFYFITILQRHGHILSILQHL